MDTPPDDGPCEVTITAPDRDWLQAFVRQLVEDRLAAAGHIDMMHTTYRWAGEVHETVEARAILHTMFSNCGDIDRRVEVNHPFEVACLAVKCFDFGSSSYISWIREESTR